MMGENQEVRREERREESEEWWREKEWRVGEGERREKRTADELILSMLTDGLNRAEWS